MRAKLAAFVLLASLTAGCAASAVERSAAPRATPGDADPVVIALLDSGINPYHSIFAGEVGPGGDVTDAATGRAPIEVQLSVIDDLESARDVDAEAWRGIEPSTLYSFVGTRILGISFHDTSSNPTLIFDDLSHGTGVAGVAAVTSPRAIIVMVEVPPEYCTPEGEPGANLLADGCVYPRGVLDGLEWAVAQPWIDVISMSFGNLANHPAPEDLEFARLTRRATSEGKLVVASAGNDPSPAVATSPPGPPWVIGVGGAQAAEGGSTLLAATFPDVVADYAGQFARADDRTGFEPGGGTSYSAPAVAAVLAEVLNPVRAQGNGQNGVGAAAAITRAALNASATMWPATAWSPSTPGETDGLSLLVYALSRTAPVVAPAAQMGWGFVDNGTADEMVRRILAGDFSVPAEKEPHVASIEAAYRAREEYWRARLGD